MKDIPLLVIFREELSIFLIAQVDIGFSSCSTGICSLGGTQWCVSLCWGNNFLGEKIQLQERTMELGIFLTEFTLGYLPVHMKTNLMIFLLSKGLAKDANFTTEKCPLFWVVPPRGRGFKKSTTSYCPISKPKESAEGEEPHTSLHTIHLPGPCYSLLSASQEGDCKEAVSQRY